MNQSYPQDLLELQSLLILNQVQQLSRSRAAAALEVSRPLATLPLQPPSSLPFVSATSPLLSPTLLSLAATTRTAQPLISTTPLKTTKSPIFWSERQRFFAFAKVLFRYLKKARVDATRAKLVVAKCVRQSQQEGSNSSCASSSTSSSFCLVSTLEQELRQCVGDVHWLRAKLLFKAYCAKLGVQPTTTTSSTTTTSTRYSAV